MDTTTQPESATYAEELAEVTEKLQKTEVSKHAVVDVFTHWLVVTACCGCLLWLLVVAACCDCLLWLLVVAACCDCLLWLLVVAACCGCLL